MPTVRIAPDARQQFFDNQGNVLAGGKLFTYLAGSATKQTTFTDSTGGTGNANPIILNSAGRTPSGLWLTEGIAYKFVLAPANDIDPPGSPIWTEDNIIGVDDDTTLDTFKTDLASTSDAAKGSALVGHLPSGTGAVGRTVQARLRDIVTTGDYSTAGNFNTARAALTATVGMDKLVVNESIIAEGPNHALGVNATAAHIGLRTRMDVVSAGGTTFCVGIDCDPSLLLAAGNTGYAAYLNVAGFGITTQAAQTCPLAASVRIAEPQITVGAAGTVDVGATLYLSSAPTEGTENATLYTDTGKVLLCRGGSGGVVIQGGVNGDGIGGGILTSVGGNAGVNAVLTTTTTASNVPLALWNKTTAGDAMFEQFYTEGAGGTLRGSIDFNRAGGLVRYNTSSDAEMKNIFGEASRERSLRIMRESKMMEFEWKDRPGERQIGPIAQMLQSAYRGAVSEGTTIEVKEDVLEPVFEEQKVAVMENIIGDVFEPVFETVMNEAGRKIGSRIIGQRAAGTGIIGQRKVGEKTIRRKIADKKVGERKVGERKVPWTVDKTAWTWHSIIAFQHLDEENAVLKQKLADLEERLIALEGR